MINWSKHGCGILLAVIAIATGLAVNAHAQNAAAPAAAPSTTLLQGSAVVDEQRAELTKSFTDQEDERHDISVSTVENDKDSENTRHQMTLKQIEQSPDSPYKQLEINTENRTHENDVKALNDRLAEENLRHGDALAQIPARVAQAIAALLPGLLGSGSGGGGSRGGNYPSSSGNGASSTSLGNNPAQTNQPGAAANPGAAPNSGTVVNPGAGQNPPNGNVPANPGVAGQAPAQSAPAQGAPANAGQTNGPNLSPLAGAIRNAFRTANDLLGQMPGGTQGLQQTAQVTGAIAKSMGDQWTHQMSPQDALMQVGGALMGGAIAKGIGSSAGVFKTALSQGLNKSAALKAAASAGAKAAINEGRTMAGLGASTAAKGDELLKLLGPAVEGNGAGGPILKGTEIQAQAGNLANKTVELPPSSDGVIQKPITLKLGQQLGNGESKFGTVYKIPNTPLVAKIIKAGNGSGETAARQAAGSKLLVQNNLPTPTQYAYYQGPAGEPSYLILQDVGESVPSGPPTAAQSGAARSLLADLGKKGLFWGDPNQNNFYYFMKNGQLKAGVLDPDPIFPWAQRGTFLTGQTERIVRNSIYGSSFLSRGGLNASAEDAMMALADKYFPPASAAAGAP